MKKYGIEEEAQAVEQVVIQLYPEFSEKIDESNLLLLEKSVEKRLSYYGEKHRGKQLFYKIIIALIEQKLKSIEY